ncbi:MAG TPA: hypothetical protein DD624_07915 [Alphaproteobacteria bacterium]|nr:hypothetical protein [Alphaproteobacteria bacterium]
MRLLSIPAVVFAAATILGGASASAQTTENALREEYEQKKLLINEMFQTKVEKIRQRTVLPQDILDALVRQADEVREFDLYTLDRKLELKLRHAKERDEIRDKLRQEAQDRVKWLLSNEEAFKATKEERAEEDLVKANKAEAGETEAAQVPAAAQAEAKQ